MMPSVCGDYRLYSPHLTLWRRIVFNVLISNTDDHLRNHGFLFTTPEGWKLSPAYDLNPVPLDIKPRILSTAIDPDDPTASLSLAFEHADYFGLDREEARAIAAEVAHAVKGWAAIASDIGIPQGHHAHGIGLRTRGPRDCA